MATLAFWLSRECLSPTVAVSIAISKPERHKASNEEECWENKEGVRSKARKTLLYSKETYIRRMLLVQNTEPEKKIFEL